MTDLSKSLEAIPERTLKLIEGWTVESLANTEAKSLTKVRGIGLKTAQTIIKIAKQQIQEEQEIKWDSERQQLRKRIEVKEYILAQQAGLTRLQKQSSTSVRVRRIKKANA